MKKHFLSSLIGVLISSLAFGPLFAASEIRKLGEYDLSWGPYGATWTSSSGKSVRYIPRYFSTDAFSDNLTLYGNDLITGGPWVDVRKYLPNVYVIDGSVNYSTYVQSAIDNMANGSTLLVPIMVGLGTSGWSGITTNNQSKITILGINGGGFKVLALPSGATPRLFNFILGDFISIKGLRFDRNGFAARIIQFDGNSDVEVSGNYFFGGSTGTIQPVVHWGSDTSGVVGKRHKYMNNVFSMNFEGHNAFYIGSNKNTYVEDVVFSGNIITNALWSAISVWGNGISITGNVVDNLTSGAAFLISQDTAPSPNTGRNVTVTGNIVRNANGGVHNDTLGDYLENIIISNNSFFNITGTTQVIGANNCHNCVVSGNSIKNGAARGIFSGYKSRNVSITGNTIDNVATSGIGVDAQTYADNIIISSNIISGATGGIVVISDNTIKNVTIANNVLTNLASGTDALSLQGVTGGTMTGVNINNNTVIGGRYGIYNDVVKVRELWGSNNRFSGQSISANNGATFVEYDSTTGKVFTRGTAAPTDNTVTWAVGDTAWNTANDNVLGWKCTTAGSPGTWKSMSVTLAP